MPYGNNISDNIGSYIHNIYEMATLVAREQNFITSLVLDLNPENEAGTAARQRSEYGTVTFNQITDADDLSSQAHTPTKQESISPAFFGAQFFLTDRRIRSDKFQLARDAAMELGEGAGKHIQTNVLADMASFTGGTVGTAGGTVTWANIAAAAAILARQKAPKPYYAVLEEGQWWHLGTAVMPAGGVSKTNADWVADAVMRNYYLGEVLGIQFFHTSDIATGTAAVGGVFARPAIGYDPRKDFGIEYQRDASQGGGGWELNATMDYGHGVWRPLWGVKVLATSVIP